MPHEPTKIQKIIMKIGRWPLSRKIKTPEQAQMVRDLLELELKKRRDFFEEYNNNFDISDNDKHTQIVILGPNKKWLSYVKLVLDKENNWYAWEFATGQFENSNELHRDLGFAKALIAKTIEEAKKRGIKRINFDAVDRNVKFFEAIGAIKNKEQPHPFTTKMYLNV